MAEDTKDVKNVKTEEKLIEVGPSIKFQLSEHLQKEFSEFGYIRMFGSSKDPLFIATDAAKAIGLKRFYLRDCPYLVKDKHYITRVISGVHAKEVILLTERGLYRLIGKSESVMADKFADFVYVILNELRTKGEITLAAAVEKFKEDAKYLNSQLDEKHTECLRLTRETERYYLQAHVVASEKEKLKLEMDDLKRRARSDIQSQMFENMKTKCMKRLYVKLEKPPKEVEEEFEYDEKDDGTTDDEEYVVSLRIKEPDNPIGDLEIWVFKDCKITQLQEFLIKKNLGIKKPDGTYHLNRYRTTVELLRDAVDEFNAQ